MSLEYAIQLGKTSLCEMTSDGCFVSRGLNVTNALYFMLATLLHVLGIRNSAGETSLCEMSSDDCFISRGLN